MPRYCQSADEVSIRMHYLIQEGKVGLPVHAALEIIQRKREMQALLRLLHGLYLRLLGEGRIEQAEQVLHCYRGLGEARFTDLFGRFGFPDELCRPCQGNQDLDSPAESAGEA